MNASPQRTSLIHRALCHLLVLAIVGGAAIVLTTIAAVPARAEGCTGTTGVTVVVDFGGGNVVTRCTDAGGTGLDVLHRAGFATVGTNDNPEAFVCGIDGVPTASQCPRTPPAAASWWYTRAPNAESSWADSSVGATSTTPANGSFEGWAIGAGHRPSLSPSDVRPPPVQQQQPAPQDQQADPTPPPAPQAPPAPANNAPPAPGSTRANSAPAPGITAAGGAETDGAAAADSPAPTDSPAPSDGASSSSASASTSASTSGPDVVTVSSAPVARHDSGSAVPTIIAVLVVVAIGIGAGVVGLRRRGRSASP